MDLLKQTSSTRENLGLLAVMEALEEREEITQRELAQATGLNLKKVNYCLHRLLEKGYVKFQRVIENPDKRAYLYILTPAGLQAKSHLTYRFLKFTLDFYNKVEAKLRQSLADMMEAGVRSLVLYGASDVARILLGMVNGEDVEVAGVVDEDYEGEGFHGVPVVKGKHLNDLVWDGVLITALDGVEEAEEHLMGLGVSPDAIWKVS